MLGDKLKDLRKKNKLTQDDIAEIFGVSKGTISNWENGRRKPNIEQLQILASYYGISMDYFMIKDLHEDHANVENLLYRAKMLLDNDDVTSDEKARLYEEIMRLYLKLKEKK